MEITVGERQPCQIYSRVVGYIRPVDDWNEAMQEVYKDRKTFDIMKGLNKELKSDNKNTVTNPIC